MCDCLYLGSGSDCPPSMCSPSSPLFLPLPVLGLVACSWWLWPHDGRVSGIVWSSHGIAPAAWATDCTSRHLPPRRTSSCSGGGVPQSIPVPVHMLTGRLFKLPQSKVIDWRQEDTNSACHHLWPNSTFKDWECTQLPQSCPSLKERFQVIVS